MIDVELQGQSLNERHRSFNGLVAAATPEHLATARTLTSADRLFSVALARKFRSKDHICALLKSSDEMVFKNALKAKWFFRGETTQDVVNAEYFCENVFPETSYKNASKIIGALAVHLQDPTEAERFYTRLLTFYGSNVAEKMLRACSEDFVRKVIMEEFYVIQDCHVVRLYEKFPLLVIEYLESYSSGKRPANSMYTRGSYSPVFILIAHDYPETFLHNLKTNRLSVKVGYRTSVILLKKEKKMFIEEPNKYINTLSLEAVLDNVKGEDFDTLIKAMLPSKQKEFNLSYLVTPFLKRMKPLFKLNYLKRIYSEIYGGASFLENDKFTDFEWAKYLPKEDMNAWAQEKIETCNLRKEDFYLKFTPVEKTIPRVKDLLASASITEERIKFLEVMVNCCKNNNDETALLDVMKFVAKRYRNDVECVRYKFMESLLNSFTLNELSPEHWEVINEMLQVMYMNKDIKNNYRQSFLQMYLEQDIQYRLNRGEEISSVLNIMEEYTIDPMDILTSDLKYQQKVFDISFEQCKNLIDSLPVDNKKSEAAFLTLFINYKKWNEKHKNQHKCYMESEWFVNQIKKWADATDDYHKRTSSILSFLQKNLKARMMFADMIFKQNFSEDFIKNMLKHNASIIANNMDVLIDRSVNDYTLHKYVQLFCKMRAYMQKSLGESLKTKLNNTLPLENKNGKHLAAIVIALSLLSEPEETEIMIKKLAPNPTKIIPGKENEFEYQRTEVLANMFKYINPPITYDTLSLYAKDDYLKFALTSLLSISFKKPTQETIVFIRSLTNKPVSVKKHSVRLAYFLYPRNELLGLYNQMWSSETNSSVREVIFQRTFRVFESCTNLVKAREVWLLLKSFLPTFQEKDKNLFRYLCSYGNVHSGILGDYFETCWKCLKVLSAAKLDVSNEISTLTISMVGYIHLLSEELCESIVMEYLNNVDINSYNARNLLIFLVSYLLQSKSVEVQNKHIEHACSIFKQFIRDNWDISVEGDFVYRSVIKQFVKECGTRAINYKTEVSPKHLMLSISDMLSVLPYMATIDMNVFLELTLIYIELQELPDFVDVSYNETNTSLYHQLIEKFGEKIAIHMRSFVATYGPEALQLYCDIVQRFEGNLIVKDTDTWKLRFILGLLKNEPSIHNRILGMELLPRSREKELYNQVTTRLLVGANNTFKGVYANRYEMSSAALFGQRPA